MSRCECFTFCFVIPFAILGLNGCGGDTNVSLSSNPSGLVPDGAVIASGTSSTTINITVPTGITTLTITGAVGGPSGQLSLCSENSLSVRSDSACHIVVPGILLPG